MTYASPETARELRRERQRAASRAQAAFMRELTTFHERGSIFVPDDVERRLSHVPCLKCGAARACKHRPWA